MFIQISPLKNNREYRLLYFGQLISFLGSMISYVAVPYQVYELTKNNSMVGLLGLVQLAPVLFFGILGGTYADRMNRRKLLLVSEFLMSLIIFLLMLNSLQEKPSVPAIFILVAILQAVLGFHRPAMEALTQVLVTSKDYGAIGALSSFRFSFGAILGPTLGGFLIAQFGAKGAYLFDFATFAVALFCLWSMKETPSPKASPNSPWKDAKEGLQFAVSKPELVGTYVIDIVAMVFAFPTALFPAMAENWGGASAAGVLFASIATGALFMTILSGWTKNILHHGRGVIFSATLWALFIVGVGFANDLWTAFAFLALAGAADMLSGLFRGVIWNETVPNQLRGRLSGIEMISYMSGPLLGNARAGWLAHQTTVSFSLWSGGVVCFMAVLLTALFLPKFWNYQSQSTKGNL